MFVTALHSLCCLFVTCALDRPKFALNSKLKQRQASQATCKSS